MDTTKEEHGEIRIETLTIDAPLHTETSLPTYTIAADSSYSIDYNSLSASLNNLNTIDLSTVSATGTIIGGNTAPYMWTSTGTSGQFSIQSAPASIEASGQMSLNGENADIKINGKSLSDWMNQIEQRLNILVPNPELEQEWDQLRRLGERYRKLEQKCKEKAEMWKQLKKMPAPRPDQF